MISCSFCIKFKQKHIKNENILTLLGRFWKSFDILGPGIGVFVFKKSMLLQPKNQETNFLASNSNFHFSVFSGKHEFPKFLGHHATKKLRLIFQGM